jgi:hypothetical protein
MFDFDEFSEPPTTGDIQQEKVQLLAQRKKLLIHSAISDAVHICIFALLYLFALVSGRGLLGVLIFSSVIALMLATRVKAPIVRSDLVQVALATCAVMAVAALFLFQGLGQALPGSLVATLASGSIVVLGSLLGSRAKGVFRSIENLEPLIDDARAQQELQLLCNRFTAVGDYRQQARDNLRPNLSYGELAAMKRWAAQQKKPNQL